MVVLEFCFICFNEIRYFGSHFLALQKQVVLHPRKTDNSSDMGKVKVKSCVKFTNSSVSWVLIHFEFSRILLTEQSMRFCSAQMLQNHRRSAERSRPLTSDQTWLCASQSADQLNKACWMHGLQMDLMPLLIVDAYTALQNAFHVQTMRHHLKRRAMSVRLLYVK